MGNKSQAKKTMVKLGVPTVPGSDGIVRSKDLLRIADEVGPMVKSFCWRRWKGMRVVEHEKNLVSSYNLAYNEAVSNFGNGDIYVEKLIQSPRHVEIQEY